MGYIEGLPYGLEFFSLKNEEDLLYDVTNLFMESNDLEITNSPLTPSLYEIPEYIEELKMYYEESENELTQQTKEYFLNYSTNTDEENETNALNLISLYQELEQKQEEQEQKENYLNVFITLLFLLITLSTILFILIYRLLTKKIRQLYKKVKK